MCGDLVRISLAVDGDRVADAGFEASGCGATIAAGSATVALVRGAPLLEAARVGPDAIAAELGGLSVGKLHAADLAADALHRALGAAAAADARLAADSERTLVALSGGVDSAVAALLCARAGRDVVGVTLELWADPDNDAERSCCSAHAVRTARALAHRLGLPHLTLDLRDRFRAGVVEPYLAEHRAGRTPNPCVACNGHVRIDAMVDLADRLGAADLATGHYARVADDRDGPLLCAAADPAKDQTYMLSALAPATLARLRLPARRPRQAAGPGAGGGGAPAGRDEGRVAGPVLPRRDGPDRVPAPSWRGASRAQGRSSIAPGASSVSTAATTSTRSGSGAGSASPRRSRSTCWRPTPAPTASWSARGPRSRAPTSRSPTRRCTGPAATWTA